MQSNTPCELTSRQNVTRKFNIQSGKKVDYFLDRLRVNLLQGLLIMSRYLLIPKVCEIPFLFPLLVISVFCSTDRIANCSHSLTWRTKALPVETLTETPGPSGTSLTMATKCWWRSRLPRTWASMVSAGCPVGWGPPFFEEGAKRFYF